MYIFSVFAKEEKYFLHKAIESGQIEEVLTILNSVEDPKSLVNTEYKAQDRHKPKLPLHIAVYEGYVEMVKLLLKYGADIEAIDEQGRTPLILASNGYRRGLFLGYSERVDIINILLDQGAKIEAFDKDGKTPLITASNHNLINTINTLLDRGAKIEAADEKGRTSLMIASSNGVPKTTNTLLDRGAKVEATDNKGQTPLMHAYANIVKILVDRGAKIEATDEKGRTPLMIASYKRKASKVKVLLDLGAKIEATDKQGNTALILANSFMIWTYRMIWSDPLNTVKILLDHGAKIATANKRGETALTLVNNHLLKNKISLQQKIKNSYRFDHAAIKWHYRRVNKELRKIRRILKRHTLSKAFASKCQLMFSSPTPSLKTVN